MAIAVEQHGPVGQTYCFRVCSYLKQLSCFWRRYASPYKRDRRGRGLASTNACIDLKANKFRAKSLKPAPDFRERVATALATDERLQMSAYDIGAMLSDQYDLITEFDALYRTSALIIRLAALRGDDQTALEALQTQRAELSQTAALASEP